MMDRDGNDPIELEQDLQNLEIINRWFGGRPAVISMLRQFVEALHLREVTVIDLCTGYGDHPRAMTEWASQQSPPIPIRIMAVDKQWDTLVSARRATPADRPIFFVQADARHLPFRDAAADISLCSLALHHFSEDDAALILTEARRVAARGVGCMDLMRGRLAYAAVWLLTAMILRARMTRHDARVSVLRAFSKDEFQDIANRAGWQKVWYNKLPWFRQSMLYLKDEA